MINYENNNSNNNSNKKEAFHLNILKFSSHGRILRAQLNIKNRTFQFITK